MITENARVLEGTWEELLIHADELRGHRLRLIVLPTEPPIVEIAPENEFDHRRRAQEPVSEAARDAARIAAIKSAQGSMAHLTVSADQLLVERQRDKVKEEEQIRRYKP